MAATSFPKAEVTQLLANRGIDMGRVLLLAETGSTAHGVSVSEQDDFDATVVRIETFGELVTGDPQETGVFGLGQSMMIRTQPEGHRSRMGDIDLNVYTLRKFVNLARKGNPSILAAIFSDRRHINTLTMAHWETLAGKVASKRAGAAFHGYLTQQIERWRDQAGMRVTRQELIEAYGFDTKYAAHAIRLGIQGIEYMKEGRFNMPMDEVYAEKLRNLRTGGFTEEEALRWAREVEGILDAAIIASPLPDHPAPTDEWVTSLYSSLVEL